MFLREVSLFTGISYPNTEIGPRYGTKIGMSFIELMLFSGIVYYLVYERRMAGFYGVSRKE